MPRFHFQIRSITLGVSFLFAGIASLLLWYAFRPGIPDPASAKLLEDLSRLGKREEEDKTGHVNSSDADDIDDGATDVTRKSGNMEAAQKSHTPTKPSSSNSATPLTSNRTSAEVNENASTNRKSNISGDFTTSAANILASIHAQIEDIDKRGKVLFKNKQYFEAAEVFTEALDLIESKKNGETGKDNVTSSSLNRQIVTLLNNRSAMYEKAELPDLALIDCDTILEMDSSHNKARTRKLRILESMERYHDALVEVCALQLKFIEENREKLKLGIPVPPPVPQSKVEELVGRVLPTEIENQMEKIKARYGDSSVQSRPLPSKHTITQLLKSFSGYNAWMAASARDGNVETLTVKLNDLQECDDVQRIELLFKRGRRYAYQKNFDKCVADFDTAYGIIEKCSVNVTERLQGDTHARVLEWVGMCKHLRYDLEGAERCYEMCFTLEPTNAEILVKRAGVKMDAGKSDEALIFFDMALGLDPTATDALLHRANLRMLQQRLKEAQLDLERCIELRPDSILARLRLATILMASEDLAAAKTCLDKAEKIDAKSSEVHSYRGELLFTQGDLEGAKVEFDRAIACDEGNPSPYLNAALVLLNTPSINGGPPNVNDAISLLEKAVDVDPQFQQAYLHLGQLKLSMALTLSAATDVVALYDKALDYCRAAEELKDIMSMRILTVAQIEAARQLKMDKLTSQ